MSAPVRKRGFLLNLAAEGMAPAVAGCASPPAGEPAIVRFGLHIIGRWLDWMQDQQPGLRQTAISELADLPASRARLEAVAAVDSFAPHASAEDRARAVEYLCALPRFAQRALVLDGTTGQFTLPARTAPDSFLSLLGLLPIDAPPCPPGSLLPDTVYLLGDLAGDGSIGTFYRATHPSFESPVLLKCCTDPALVALLRQHVDSLTPPVAADRWNSRLLRLLAVQLDHATPHLVFEHVPGGDLTMLLRNLKHQTGRGPSPDEVFRLIEQIAEGLAFAHALGLVHGDVKPSNVLVNGEALVLADLGVGLVTARHAVIHSQLGKKPLNQLGVADQASLLRGSASLLYLSAEQKRGDAPDPRHDLHALGVLWYQLLIADVTREPGPAWMTELAEEQHVRGEHIGLIERCLAQIEDRPRDGGALLLLMRPQGPHAEAKPLQAESVVSPEEVRRERLRKQSLLRELKELRNDIATYQDAAERSKRFGADDVFCLLLLPIAFGLAYALVQNVLFAVCVGILAAVPAWLLRAGRRRSKVALLLKPVQDRSNRLDREHPDEVQTWGGPQALLNPQLLPEILAAFEEDMRTLALDEQLN